MNTDKEFFKDKEEFFETTDKPSLQKRVLEKEIVLGRTSAIQEEPFCDPYFLEYVQWGFQFQYVV